MHATYTHELALAQTRADSNAHMHTHARGDTHQKQPRIADTAADTHRTQQTQ